jgi:hypothetical protein
LRIAIYTCITKNYDTLKIPLVVDNRLQYFCFTDNQLSVVSPWRFLPLCQKDLSAKDQNRYVKMHPEKYFSEYDATVYVDGSIQIVGDIYPLIIEVLTEPENIYMYRHWHRNCVYAEAAACAHYSHDWIWTIASQMRRYSSAGYPVQNGLFEANVIIRKNSIDVRVLMDQWWTEYMRTAKRDQLSLPYVAWRLGIKLGSLGESDPRVLGHYFRFINHPTRRSLLPVIRKYVNRSVALLIPYDKLFGINVPVIWR